MGAAHCGRPGLLAGVVRATVGGMRDLGARAIAAWIGPHVCGACYEVPAEMRAEVAAVVPESRAVTSWGTPALDIGAGVRAQLEARGVAVIDVSAAAPASRRTSTPTAATARPPAGWPASSGLGRRMSDRRDEIEPGSPRSAAGSPPPAPRPAAAPTTSRSSSSPSFPRLGRADPRRPRGHRRRARTGTRRPWPRPRSAPTWPAPGTSSADCRATRRPRSRSTPTSCTRSTGAKLLGGWPAVPSGATGRSTCCSR